MFLFFHVVCKISNFQSEPQSIWNKLLVLSWLYENRSQPNEWQSNEISLQNALPQNSNKKDKKFINSKQWKQNRGVMNYILYTDFAARLAQTSPNLRLYFIKKAHRRTLLERTLNVGGKNSWKCLISNSAAEFNGFSVNPSRRNHWVVTWTKRRAAHRVDTFRIQR